MNFLLTFFGSGGVWILFTYFKESPSAVPVAFAIMTLAGITGIFAFRFLFDLILPDPPSVRHFDSSEDWEDDWCV